jgi:hypothetical protein
MSLLLSVCCPRDATDRALERLPDPPRVPKEFSALEALDYPPELDHLITEASAPPWARSPEPENDRPTTPPDRS